MPKCCLGIGSGMGVALATQVATDRPMIGRGHRSPSQLSAAYSIASAKRTAAPGPTNLTYAKCPRRRHARLVVTTVVLCVYWEFGPISDATSPCEADAWSAPAARRGRVRSMDHATVWSRKMLALS